MPNWCSTQMTITGPEDSCRSFISRILVKQEEEDTYDFSTPAPYEITGKRIVTSLHIIEGLLPCPAPLYEVRSPVRDEDQAQADANQLLYGATDWHSWQDMNWGVKWGDCHTAFVEEALLSKLLAVTYSYDTPWSTATTAFLSISGMFPELRFDFFHEEEAGFFQGCEVIKNGSVVLSSFFSPNDYNEEAPSDFYSAEYQQWSDAFDKWRHLKQEAIDAQVDAIDC